MSLPVDTGPLVMGAVIGAATLAVVGFGWGGWTTAAKAEAAASLRAESAVVDALAPICVARFRMGTDVKATLVALRREQSWAQGDFVEKGGWAAIAPGAAPARVSAVAKLCAQLLASG